MELISGILYHVTPIKLSNYENKAVYFSKPQMVAYYEYNYGRITPAKRILYLKEPKPQEYPLDLNADLGKYVKANPGMHSENINASLKYSMSTAAERNGAENLEKTKVITRRGTLVALMESFYLRRSCELRIRVSRYNNNLYMVREEYDFATEFKLVNTHHSQFVNFLFADSPNGISKAGEPIDENIMLLCVHQSNFGKYNMIYSGEIQGIIDNEKITDFDNLDYLADRRFVATKQMWSPRGNNDPKYLKFFLQSYLANIREIYIGYKERSGLIHQPIENILTKDLRQNRRWKPSICTGFLYDFLENVERIMSSVNCLNTVYEFQYHNQESKFFSYKVFTGKTDKTFITEEYIQFCNDRLDI